METAPATTNLDNALMALADPTRRKILEHLGQGESRITDVASLFPISLNSVSKHIKLLERGNLVQRRVVGRDHFLRINPQPLESIQHWIASRHAFWQSNLWAIDKMLKKAGNSPINLKKRKTSHAKNG